MTANLQQRAVLLSFKKCGFLTEVSCIPTLILFNPISTITAQLCRLRGEKKPTRPLPSHLISSQGNPSEARISILMYVVCNYFLVPFFDSMGDSTATPVCIPLSNTASLRSPVQHVYLCVLPAYQLWSPSLC